MRRLLLVVNVNAQTVTPAALGIITRALSSEFRVEQVRTEGRGHATRLAAGATAEGFDLVVAFGGDGTVNEVVNGIAGGDLPLAILPGGGANVFARSLGIPRDPIEAAVALLERLGEGPRRVSLGRIDGRWFAANCGVGLDAAIVRRVEQRQFAKRAVGDGFFVWSALRVLASGYDRRTPHLALRWGEGADERREGLFLVVAQNIDPYTYLGERPIRLCPEAGGDGLDCIALDSLAVRTVGRTVVGMFGRGARGPHALHLAGRTLLCVESDAPAPVHVDGEFVGERERVEISAVPGALAVLGA